MQLRPGRFLLRQKMATKNKKMGLPTSLTPEVQSIILACIKKGAYVETAVVYAGINKDTYYEWMKRAEKEQPGQLHRDFSDAVEKAKAEAELLDITIVDKAARGGQWQASAWRLERKFPQKWGRRTEVDIGQKAESTLSEWLQKVLTGDDK